MPNPTNCIYINVLDYGAVGDGSTNDYLAIESAINAANVSGSTVFFPAGIYAIDSIIDVPAGVTLLGEGKGSSSTGTPSNGSIIKNISTLQTIRVSCLLYTSDAADD